MKKNPAIRSIIVVEPSRMSGRIWIGDPCYVMKDREWDRMNQLMFESDGSGSNQMYEIEFADGKRYQFFVWHVGDDGEYSVMIQGAKLGSVGVDSCCLAFMPTELVDRLMEIYPDNQGIAGCVVTVPVPEIPESVSRGGVIGSVTVPHEEPEEPEESEEDRIARESCLDEYERDDEGL